MYHNFVLEINLFFQKQKKVNKMKKLTLTAIAFTILMLTSNLVADNNFGIELRPGVNYAVQDIQDAELGVGVGAELTFFYNIKPYFSIYLGWSYNNFAEDQSFIGPDGNFEETGYTFGFQYLKQISETILSLVIRAGGTYNHIEIENNKGEIVIDSGHGLGWQVETGLKINISEKFSLIPSIRYRALNRVIKIDQVDTPVDLNYLSLGLGFNWTF